MEGSLNEGATAFFPARTAAPQQQRAQGMNVHANAVPFVPGRPQGGPAPPGTSGRPAAGVSAAAAPFTPSFGGYAVAGRRRRRRARPRARSRARALTDAPKRALRAHGSQQQQQLQQQQQQQQQLGR